MSSSKPAIPKTKHHDFDINPKTGVIEVDIVLNWYTEIYTKTIDLKAFLKELAQTLLFNNTCQFTDRLEEQENPNGEYFEHFSPQSEFAKPPEHDTRSANMFEYHFVWAKHDGFDEMETWWRAKSKSTRYSEHGLILFKLDLVCRGIQEVEVEVDGKKKKMLKGAWEFRNQFQYRNYYIPRVLHKIPIVKDSALLQQKLLDSYYYPTLHKDIEYAEATVKPLIWNVIYKHFK